MIGAVAPMASSVRTTGGATVLAIASPAPVVPATTLLLRCQVRNSLRYRR